MPALPPGPRAPAPLQTIAFARDPLGALLRARARHGRVFTLRFAGMGPVVVVAVPEAVDDLVPSDPERSHAGEARRAVLPQASPRSTFGSDGETHRAARRRIHPPFAPEAIDRHATEIAAIAKRHLDGWPTRRPFRVLPRMRTLVEEIFVRTVLGVRDDERAAALTAAVRRLLLTPGNPPLTPPDRDEQPPVGPLLHRTFERRLEPIRAIFAAEIDAQRRAGTAAADNGIIAALLADDPQLTADRAVDELTVVLAAAQEPPAIALTWFVHELAHHRDVANRLAGTPSGDDYWSAAIDESLRLRPPALASLRRLTRPATVDGHDLEAGTDVMVSIPLIHRDPAIFPDPHEFRPERFQAAPRPSAFFPFGRGERDCPGQPLARTEFKSIVPAILERFDMTPAWPHPERPVQRATVLPPNRSGLMIAR